MVQFAGHFQSVKNEGFKEFISALTKDESFAEKVASLESTIDVKLNGQVFGVVATYPNRSFPVSFTPGVEFEDKLPNGDILKSVAVINGNKIVITSKKADELVGERIYEFSDDRLVLSMNAKSTSLVGKRYYKRV